MWNYSEEEEMEYRAALNCLNEFKIRKARDDELNELVKKTEKMMEEVNELHHETQTFQIRITEADRCMSWTEKRLEDIRRQQNRSAAIIWNFPDDLHPLAQSDSLYEKTDAVLDFFVKTVGVPDDLAGLLGIQHIRVFYTIFQSERSANVRLQFMDDESKSLCESYIVPFLKTFNQMRPRPTRWREDQTEMQRDEEKDQRQKQQQQQRPEKTGGNGNGLFTKFIPWPPPQRA